MPRKNKKTWWARLTELLAAVNIILIVLRAWKTYVDEGYSCSVSGGECWTAS
jgi:hypothetical protein